MFGFAVTVSGCSNNAYPASTNPTSNPTTTTPSTVSPSTNSPATPAQNQAGPKITDPQYTNKAYLISGDSLDATAQTATSGFNISKIVNSDGTTTFTLTSTNPEYQDQSYTLQPGQKLYFIEMNLGDDYNNNEGNLGDDRAVITDADGNIIQS